MDWEGSWENNNDLGHSLVTFEILGEQLKEEHIKASLFWSTRWLKFDRMTKISSAINDSGDISPNGKAIEIWGNFIGNKMVESNSTLKIRTFASSDFEKNKLFVYMINKDFHAKPVKLNLENFPAKKALLRQFSGSGPLDKNPVLLLKNDIEAIENNLLVHLPAVSITILEISQEENSITEKTSDSQLKIYPNPSKGIINIGLKGITSEEAELYIKNLNGQTVLFQTNMLGEDKSTVSIQEIPSGIYLLQLKTDEQIYTKKIVLIK
ncbi:MAG: T9SS type A sorting domain-containing protein [Bacteroidota bacterium]|nr:T9SS type A sorting domain-containing protein [Bacteroidota bacterium]